MGLDMHLVGIGTFGASAVAALWLNAERRRLLESNGSVHWWVSETSPVALLTNKRLQKALTSGADMVADAGLGPFNPPANAHIVVGLGGIGAIRLVEAASQGRLWGCTIHALLPFNYDVYRSRAVQAAAALKLWEMTDSHGSLFIVDAADYTNSQDRATVILQKIQDRICDSVCESVAAHTGQILA